jgi:plastocyanin
MVAFILIWTLASIPALIILFLLGLALSTVAFGLIRRGNAPDLTSVLTRPTRNNDAPVRTEAPPVIGNAAPITGRVYVVRMLGDDNGYRFQPANLTIGRGDGVKFVLASGAPHNIAFDPATIPADVGPQLSANMPNQQGELSSPLLTEAGDSYTISFGNIQPGFYVFHCTPHLAMGMKGMITVR